MKENWKEIARQEFMEFKKSLKGLKFLECVNEETGQEYLKLTCKLSDDSTIRVYSSGSVGSMDLSTFKQKAAAHQFMVYTYKDLKDQTRYRLGKFVDIEEGDDVNLEDW